MSTSPKVSRECLRRSWKLLRTQLAPLARRQEDSRLKMIVVVQEFLYEPRVSNQQLADRLWGVKNYIGDLVNRAEAEGYIERFLEQTDGHRRFVAVTKKGRRALKEVVAKLATKLAEAEQLNAPDGHRREGR